MRHLDKDLGRIDSEFVSVRWNPGKTSMSVLDHCRAGMLWGQTIGIEGYHSAALICELFEGMNGLKACSSFHVALENDIHGMLQLWVSRCCYLDDKDE